LYADAHDGRLPRRGQGIQPTTVLHRPQDWFNALPPLMDSVPYLELTQKSIRPRGGESSVWICPEAEDTDQVAFFSYGMNMALSTWLAPKPDHIERVGPQQTMVFMADGKGPFCSILPRAQPYSPLARHIGGTVNIAFLDGHVAAFDGAEVGCGTGDPERPDIRWVPPNAIWTGPPH
jgi:prepilin-type processing-associated H-X9-DG protein